MDIGAFSNSASGSILTIDDEGSPAFNPFPLDGCPDLSTGTWETISRASHALGTLMHAGQLLPAPELLHRPAIRREAQSTSALEGTFAPLEDVLASDLGAIDQTPETREIQNYVDIVAEGLDWASDDRPLTVSWLSGLQARLVAGTRSDTTQAGRVRGIQVAIGGTTLADARYVPLPPGPTLEASVSDLTSWISDRGTVIDPVVAAALAHYQFEAIHPFNDGNGRLGRLLIMLMLIRGKVLDAPTLSVSPWLEARRREYIDLMFGVSARGEWDGWVHFFALGIEQSALDSSARVHDLLTLRTQQMEHVKSMRASPAVRDITELLIGYPVVTVPVLRDVTGLSNATVNEALKLLTREGLLQRRAGKGRTNIYLSREVLAILIRKGFTSTTADR